MTILKLGNDQVEFDLDAAFPPLPRGNIYCAVSGGIESTILLYLLTRRYSGHDIIPASLKLEGRRGWEPSRGKRTAMLFGLADKHVTLDYRGEFGSLVDPATADEYFQVENEIFDMARYSAPNFVAGFTGKNTTALDPVIITPDEQRKYLVHNKIHRPFMMLDKHHTIDLYYKLGVEHLLQYTHTCTQRGQKHCGRCFACYERIDGFDRLGKRDPAIYEKDFDQLVLDVRERLPAAIKYELAQQQLKYRQQ